MAKSKKDKETNNLPAPKGGRNELGQFLPQNLFALGCKTSGKPPIIKTTKELITKLSEYIEYEDKKKRPDSYSKEGKGIYTIEGAALFLGFQSRQSLHDYANRNPEYAYVIDRFKLFLTHWNVQKLYWAGTFPGAKFWLMNHGGYKEEVTQNQNHTVTTVEPRVFYTDIGFAESEDQVE